MVMTLVFGLMWISINGSARSPWLSRNLRMKSFGSPQRMFISKCRALQLSLPSVVRLSLGLIDYGSKVRFLKTPSVSGWLSWGSLKPKTLSFKEVYLLIPCAISGVISKKVVNTSSLTANTIWMSGGYLFKVWYRSSNAIPLLPILTLFSKNAGEATMGIWLFLYSVLHLLYGGYGDKEIAEYSKMKGSHGNHCRKTS